MTPAEVLAATVHPATSLRDEDDVRCSPTVGGFAASHCSPTWPSCVLRTSVRTGIVMIGRRNLTVDVTRSTAVMRHSSTSLQRSRLPGSGVPDDTGVASGRSSAAVNMSWQNSRFRDHRRCAIDGGICGNPIARRLSDRAKSYAIRLVRPPSMTIVSPVM